MMKRIKMVLYFCVFFPLVMTAQDSISLMGYRLSDTVYSVYEEGCYGASVIKFNSGFCFAFYFNGAMMATPIYLRQVGGVEYVHQMDSLHTESRDTSQTGCIYHGKSVDGTYFVEKLFYARLHGLPQGIILFKIPADYYEILLQKVIDLPQLPPSLFLLHE